RALIRRVGGDRLHERAVDADLHRQRRVRLVGVGRAAVDVDGAAVDGLARGPERDGGGMAGRRRRRGLQAAVAVDHVAGRAVDDRIARRREREGGGRGGGERGGRQGGRQREAVGLHR